MENYTIKELCYELYKADWLGSHITPEMKANTIKEWYKETEEKYRDENSLFGYIAEHGYDGIFYSFFEEFLDNEYLDVDYMSELLNDKELQSEYAASLIESILDDACRNYDNLGELIKSEIIITNYDIVRIVNESGEEVDIHTDSDPRLKAKAIGARSLGGREVEITIGSLFKDERGELITEDELMAEYEASRERTFEEYVNDCLSKDGTLTRLV